MGSVTPKHPLLRWPYFAGIAAHRGHFESPKCSGVVGRPNLVCVHSEASVFSARSPYEQSPRLSGGNQ